MTASSHLLLRKLVVWKRLSKFRIICLILPLLLLFLLVVWKRQCPTSSWLDDTNDSDSPFESAFASTYDVDEKSDRVNDALIKRKVLNVYFTVNPANSDAGGDIFEADWISNVLFGALDRPLRVFYGPASKHRHYRANDTITIFLFKPPTPTYFEDLTRANFVNQIGFHMGDELMGNNISYYKHAAYIFRNYYNEEYEKNHSNVRWVPLGMKSGFGLLDPQAVLPSSKRRKLCNFVGSLRSNRLEAVNVMKTAGVKCYLDYCKEWASKTGMNVVHYRNLLRESVFTLAPWGNNPESLRLYESMEAGSIPLFQRVEDPGRNPLTAFGSACPLPQFANWSEAATYVAEMQRKPVLVDKLQMKLIHFWKMFKTEMQAEIKDAIDKAFHAAHGYQC